MLKLRSLEEAERDKDLLDRLVLVLIESAEEWLMIGRSRTETMLEMLGCIVVMTLQLVMVYFERDKAELDLASLQLIV